MQTLLLGRNEVSKRFAIQKKVKQTVISGLWVLYFNWKGSSTKMLKIVIKYQICYKNGHGGLI